MQESFNQPVQLVTTYTEAIEGAIVLISLVYVAVAMKAIEKDTAAFASKGRRGVILLVIGLVILPLSGMNSWEYEVRSLYPLKPLLLTDIVPVGMAASAAVMAAVGADKLIALLVKAIRGRYGSAATTRACHMGKRVDD